MEGKGNLLWWAESSLSRMYSFTFQIDLITEGLTERGWNVYVGDPDYQGDGYHWKLPHRQIISLPREIDSHSFLHLLADLDIKAIIILGYLDRFPLLAKLENCPVPVYFWSQASKKLSPVRYPQIRAPWLYFVPLTDGSGKFLKQSGVANLTFPIPHAVNHRKVR